MGIGMILRAQLSVIYFQLYVELLAFFEGRLILLSSGLDTKTDYGGFVMRI